MDDLSSKINEILSDPQTMQQIKGLTEMLGISDSSEKQKPIVTENKQSMDMLSGLSALQQNNDMLSMMTRLVPLLSDMNKEDDTSRLLLALKPFLSEERKKKLAQAEKIIKIMKLLPLLKGTPLLDSLF